MQFGEKLRQLRQERNLTQPDLAEQLGIEQSWLSKLENDKSLPSSDLLDSICRVFNISLEHLLADLDPHYLRNQLATLPEVRGLLQEKRYQLVHNTRRWLLTATGLVAVGITLLVSGYFQWLFNEERYIYESTGIVFETEPEHLFDKPESNLMPLVLEQIDELSQSENGLNQYYRSNISRLHELFYEKNKAKLQQRSNSEVHMTGVFRGEYYRSNTTVPEDSIDIYGNVITAGAPGHRIFSLESSTQIPQWPNRLFMLLGSLLFATGFLLYFVEWRMAKATVGRG